MTRSWDYIRCYRTLIEQVQFADGYCLCSKGEFVSILLSNHMSITFQNAFGILFLNSISVDSFINFIQGSFIICVLGTADWGGKLSVVLNC